MPRSHARQRGELAWAATWLLGFVAMQSWTAPTTEPHAVTTGPECPAFEAAWQVWPRGCVAFWGGSRR